MKNPESKHGKKIESKLVSYLMRMAHRPTPFGLFAGCSVGEFSSDNKFHIGDRDTYRRYTRLDVDYLDELTETLTNIYAIRKDLMFKPNSSLFYYAGLIRYTTAYITNSPLGRQRHFFLSTMKITPYLKQILNFASEGVSYEELSNYVNGLFSEITLSQAESLIDFFIEKQLLLSDLTPIITGNNPLSELISQLRNCKSREAVEITEILDSVDRNLREIDLSAIGVSHKQYLKVIKLLNKLPVRPDSSRIFHVDMMKTEKELFLSQRVLNQIKRNVKLLYDISPPQKDILSSFRKAFTTRYGQREMPLCEVLDEEIGIGTLIKSIDSDHHKQSDPSPNFSDDSVYDFQQKKRNKYLFWKIAEALSSRAKEINFENNDIESLITEESKLPIPDSFSVTCILASKSAEDLKKGRYHILIKSISGPSGAKLFGRFCHLDNVLKQNVNNFLITEEQLHPQAVFAEIVHLPQGRAGNVICRPVLRRCEIPLLGRSGAALENQIPFTDLLISVKNDRFILRSARIGCEVIPRLTTAHVYCNENHIPGYSFLGILAKQNTRSDFSWKWGQFKNSLPFLPRLTAQQGKLILSRAIWNIKPEEINELLQKENKADFLKNIQKWCFSRSIPRFAALVKGDQELLIDFNKCLSINAFIEQAKKHVDKSGLCSLTEIFPAPDELCISSSEGVFTHEIIIPFTAFSKGETKNRTNYSPVSDLSEKIATKPSTPTIQRSFTPHSEWMYLKLYGGSLTLDRLLAEDIYPVLNDSFEKKIIEKWFFIRYNDPDFHIRIRIHDSSEKQPGEIFYIMEMLTRKLLSENKIYRVQYDTYEREIEKYGGASGLLLAEQIFFVDSETSGAVIGNQLRQGYDADERWRLALLGVHKLLIDFRLSLYESHRIVENLCNIFKLKIKSKTGFRYRISQAYREHRDEIENLLKERNLNDSYTAASKLLNNRSNHLISIFASMEQSSDEKISSLISGSIISNFLHLHINRILAVPEHTQEFAIYEYLRRFYKSKLSVIH